MNKTITTYINDFSGGMTNAIRSKNTRFARSIKQFDILTAKNKMIPNPGMEVETFETGDASSTKISKYIAANNVLYGLGVKATTAYAKVFTKSSPSAGWTAVATGESAAGTRNESLFVEYKNKLYGARYVSSTDTRIWSWDYTDNTFTEDAIGSALDNHISSATAPMSGLRFKKDDILYIGYDNIIIRYNGTTWTEEALKLPTDEVITSLCEYGDYLAIAVKPKYYGGRSNVYLWDRNSSVATLSEKADWGMESLELIEELNGRLIGVSTNIHAQSITLTDAKLIFKEFVGGTAGCRPLMEISSLTSLTIHFAGSQKTNNRIYFMMDAKIDDVQCNGIFSFGKLGDNYAFSMDRLINNDTAITTPIVKGFLLYGDWMHAAYTTAGTYVANRTQSASPWTDGTAIYESLKFDGSIHGYNSSYKKDLKGVTVMTEPLPTAGTVILEYRTDHNTSWTQIFKETTDNSISYSAVNADTDVDGTPDAELPKAYKEIEFRIESTNQAVITGLEFTEEITGQDRPY